MKINILAVCFFFLTGGFLECTIHQSDEYKCEAPYSLHYDRYYCYSFRNIRDSSILNVYSYKDSCSLSDRYDSINVAASYKLLLRKADSLEEQYILSTLSINQVPYVTDFNKAKGMSAFYLNKDDATPIYVCNSLCGQRCSIKRN